MKKTCKLLGVLLLLTALPGCGGWDTTLRDWNVWINEVCDTMLMVTDDASAKKHLAGQFKLLDVKFEKLRLDTEKKVQSVEQLKDKEERLNWQNAALDYHEECKASIKRLNSSLERLTVLINGTSDNENLKRVRDFQWGNTPLAFQFQGTPFPTGGGVFMPPP
ncbi:MAG TPA: hypothetical protein VE988_06440 [Gemmataceae bacterium]|nr:hypothetical protein [Gemmataceae bacterium]